MEGGMGAGADWYLDTWTLGNYTPPFPSFRTLLIISVHRHLARVFLGVARRQQPG